MIDELKGKKVKIGVALMDDYTKFLQSSMTTRYFEGVIKTSSTLGGEMFVVFDDNFMINAKYVQTIEIIG